MLFTGVIVDSYSVVVVIDIKKALLGKESEFLRGGGGGRALPECHFYATYMGSMEISRSLHSFINLCYGVFCKFFGDFWVFLEGKQFFSKEL